MTPRSVRPKPGLILPTRRRLIASIAGGLAFAAMARAGLADDDEEQGPPKEDGLTPTRNFYGTLASYSDTGSVETEYQWPDTPALAERHTFQTAFRAPRNFFFRFDADPNAGGDAFVIWCDGGDFQSWWKATGVHDVYDGGRGASAFTLAEEPTKRSANVVAPMLFAKADLYGPAVRLFQLSESGTEDLAGKTCRKFVAPGRATGVVTTDNRPITIWVDSEANLIRRIEQAEQADAPPKLIDRLAYTFEPAANPELADSLFAFTPPT